MNAVEKKVRWEEMFPDELREAIRGCPVCLAAYGLAEPHGPYNAIGLDFLKARALLERAARAHGGVVAPPFAWHIQERPEFDWPRQHGVEQSYCSSIPAALFYKMVLYQVRAMDARGFHAGILVTGHYGGLENDMRLLCEFYRRKTGSPIRLRALADCELIRYEDYRGDHAGVCETSQMMFLHPDLVDLLRDAATSPMGPFGGTTFPTKNGRTPSAELGEKIVTSQIDRLAEIERELLRDYEPRKDWAAPSFPAVEGLWARFEDITRKYWWCSRTWDEWQAGESLEFPGWDVFGE